MQKRLVLQLKIPLSLSGGGIFFNLPKLSSTLNILSLVLYHKPSPCLKFLSRKINLLYNTTELVLHETCIICHLFVSLCYIPSC